MDARDRPRLLGLERAHVRARERGVHVQLALDAEACEPARVGRGGERRVRQGHDHPHPVALIALGPRKVGHGAHVQQRLLDDAARRAIDGAGRRPGGHDDGDE